ncbi:MSMEG_1061 family FMN-dependent PPOX-type flavoprotein [Rhodovibrio salinarum]|uniref:Pyridoxamine 5'-phosphate oxidase N-terminal domain-containing protein n=1 Tax=Rhodovibrio salinarum TaxID=1087 RepID=A0A934QJ43_9PROT|nr:MSMEG_1061 family FMN-dependent PPOX-type flavoprotein [Rhodovibrio salinarum]MBK1697958.1 hypothetical protein [Rhodovibrio salinarum]
MTETIQTIDQLRALYPDAKPVVRQKELSALDRHARRFVELSPFVILGTQGATGNVDTSPRGGPPGVVRVASDRTLLLPDLAGNNRLDSLQNIVERPAVSLIFLIPGINETLRVRGRAEIVVAEAMLQTFEVDGKRPRSVLRITVDAVYLHCGKALMHAALWDPEIRIDRASLPSLGAMIRDQIGEGLTPEQ